MDYSQLASILLPAAITMLPIYTFYRNFIYPASAFTLFSCYLLLSSHNAAFAMFLFWMKAFTTTIIGLFFHFTRPEELTFFHNLGYSTTQLYLRTAALDMTLWLFLTILAAQTL